MLLKLTRYLEASLILGLLLKALYWVLMFIEPIQKTMGYITFLIMVDFITGMVATKKMRAPFSMEKFGWALSKFFLYNLMIITGLVLENLVAGIPSASIMGGFIGMWEFKSIGRNFNNIYGFDVFQVLKRWITNRNKDFSEITNELRNEKPRKS